LNNAVPSNANAIKVDLNIEAPFVKIVHECIVKSKILYIYNFNLYSFQKP